MDENDLEEVMHRFVQGEADVLVSTTIIESGLDIPNANTIIIDRADRFGLADLYQLRGRVGRAQHKAYAYLLLPPGLMTVGEARRRINAIKQYSTLGAGLKSPCAISRSAAQGIFSAPSKADILSISASTSTVRS
jgi:transcription-repair coupling factor (superfamily II helicase)